MVNSMPFSILDNDSERVEATNRRGALTLKPCNISPSVLGRGVVLHLDYGCHVGRLTIYYLTTVDFRRAFGCVEPRATESTAPVVEEALRRIEEATERAG